MVCIRENRKLRMELMHNQFLHVVACSSVNRRKMCPIDDQYNEKPAPKTSLVYAGDEKKFSTNIRILASYGRGVFFHVRTGERIIPSEEQIGFRYVSAAIGKSVDSKRPLQHMAGGDAFGFERLNPAKGMQSRYRTILRLRTRNKIRFFESDQGNLGAAQRIGELSSGIFVFKRFHLEAQRPWMTASKEGDA